MLAGEGYDSQAADRGATLIRKAYDALPQGGAFVVIEALIDDARRENAFWSAYVAQHVDRIRRCFRLLGF